jgi:hypothetical protein
MNKKIIVPILILVSSIGLFSGCSLLDKGFESENNSELEQKNAVISISGKLSQSGELFFITDNIGKIHDVETYSVDFEKFIGQSITATGQYSGDTLFVTEISL